MDVAIQVQEILLGEDRVIFKPIGIIKGKYIEDKDIFQDEYGYEYYSMNGSDMYNDRYFCCPTNIERLREIYDKLENDVDVLDAFLSTVMESCFIGYYDDVTNSIKLIDINFSKIREAVISDEYELDIEEGQLETIELDPENNDRFVFNLEALKRIKDYQTVDEIREFIDKLIYTGEYVQSIVEKENKKEQEKGVEVLEKSKLKLAKEESSRFNLAKLRSEVLANIIGQEEAVYDLTRTIAINQTSKNPRNKSHILISGPSGTGKTEMVRVIAKELDIPFFAANTPDYTKAGYHGKEVPDLLLGLVRAANGDLEKAQQGILILDEIDKLVTFQDDKGFGKAVLHEMLKILDRDVIEIDVEKGRNNKIMFDTSNLTVICMGSFDELYEQKQQNKKKSIGFECTNNEVCNKVRLEEEDFIRWMGPEFVGRVGEFTETDELTHKEVLRILKESKLSQFKIAQQDFADRGIQLCATSGYLNAVAEKGYSKKLGARKINKVVKRTLRYVYDEAITNPKIKSIKLTKKTVENNREYCVEY